MSENLHIPAKQIALTSKDGIRPIWTQPSAPFNPEKRWIGQLPSHVVPITTGGNRVIGYLQAFAFNGSRQVRLSIWSQNAATVPNWWLKSDPQLDELFGVIEPHLQDRQAILVVGEANSTTIVDWFPGRSQICMPGRITFDGEAPPTLADFEAFLDGVIKAPRELEHAGADELTFEPSVADAARTQAQPDDAAHQNAPKRNHVIDGLGWASDLLLRELSPLVPVVDRVLVEGVTVLAGQPKAGKSWLGLTLGCAVATGTLAFGELQVQQGDVLYLALEDSERRLHERLLTLLPEGATPDRLQYLLRARPLEEGCIDDLEAWIRSVSRARLIIIDVFKKVRRKQRGYDDDYEAIGPLKQLAERHGVAIVIIHHTNKKIGADLINSVSGTNGLTGAADTTLVLTRHAEDNDLRTLQGRGRDIEDFRFGLAVRNARWSILPASATTAVIREERQTIIDALAAAAGPIGPSAIADAVGAKPENIKVLLRKMEADGQVRRLGVGQYALPGPEQPNDHDDHHDYRDYPITRHPRRLSTEGALGNDRPLEDASRG